jgi:hypothetical protein
MLTLSLLLLISLNSILLFTFLKINNNKIPIEYSKPAKPNIKTLVLNNVISSFIAP